MINLERKKAMQIFFRPAICICRLLISICAILLLGACAPDNKLGQLVDDCESFGELRVVCGVQAPEDLALLPDASGLLLSEYGGMQGSGGRISLFDIDSESVHVLYDADSANDLKLAQNAWGELGCEQAGEFSPHGFDLARRPGGRWQLLVVNHAERESIEFFELYPGAAGDWQLAWRGCVLAPGNVALNDVAATGSGFVVSQMSSKSRFKTLWSFMLGRDNSKLWRWTLERGLDAIDGLDGVGFNGVASDNAGKRFFINAWGEGKLLVYDRISKKLTHEVALPHGDNSTWDAASPGKLLVASQRGSLFSMARCVSKHNTNCATPFDITEFDTRDMQHKILFRSDGQYFGGGTTAVRVKDTLYIGSFTGQRLLIAPVGYGTQSL